MRVAIHRDPTFEKVLAMQVRERKCAVCDKGGEVFDGVFRCTVNLSYPACRSAINGFALLER